LTDGLDNTRDKTAIVSSQLKNELHEKGIYSKFSVIGIGNHESPLLGKMAEIGTQRGLYFYVSSHSEGETCSKIERFFAEAILEA